MEGYGPATYGERWADVYDRFVSGTPIGCDTDVEVATLAGPGPVLELGIGTGRVALPLVKRGLAVAGIEASQAILERLRAKAGGERIPVAVGNFADVKVEGRFSLVFATFATFFALASQDEQVRCFANVADHLTDDGLFVIEAFVPDPSRFTNGHGISALRVDVDQIELDVARHEPVAQRVQSQRVVIGEDGIKLRPTQIRYAYPPELDLMARLAGLRLRERWGAWDRRRFDATSPRHVSVYAHK